MFDLETCLEKLCWLWGFHKAQLFIFVHIITIDIDLRCFYSVLAMYTETTYSYYCRDFHYLFLENFDC